MKKILDFRNRSYSDVSGKYQNMESHLNIREGSDYSRTRRSMTLGLGIGGVGPTKFVQIMILG